MREGWHTFAGRLRWAVYEHQPWQGRRRGLRLFQSRIEKAAVAGTSLSAIQGYLRGDTEPSPGFIFEAARILKVRPAWLAWHDGAPTEEEEAARRESPEGELFRISTAVYEALGVPTQVPEGDRFWGSAVWAPMARQTALRLYQHRPAWELLAGGAVEHPSSGPRADESWAAAIGDIAGAIAAPLYTLGMDGSKLDLSDVADYVQATALALQRAIYQYRPGDLREQEADHGDEA